MTLDKEEDKNIAGLSQQSNNSTWVTRFLRWTRGIFVLHFIQRRRMCVLWYNTNLLLAVWLHTYMRNFNKTIETCNLLWSLLYYYLINSTISFDLVPFSLYSQYNTISIYCFITRVGSKLFCFTNWKWSNNH